MQGAHLTWRLRHDGNIPALRNQFKLEDVVARGFIETEARRSAKCRTIRSYRDY